MEVISSEGESKFKVSYLVLDISSCQSTVVYRSESRYICTLHCSTSTNEFQVFKNEREYATRFEAKDAAARLALVSNVIELADPTGMKRQAGRELVSHSAVSTRGSYRGAYRGGMRGIEFGSTGTYRGGKPAFRGGFATGSNRSSPIKSTPTPRSFSTIPGRTHNYPTQAHNSLARANYSPAPPHHHPNLTSAASTLNSACQEMMKFGNLPLYEHSKDYQST